MMIGTIARWGFKGFGFVEADGLPTPAWTHAEYLDDPSYEPRAGDRVEFELKRLPDGRVQARRVRPVKRGPASVAATLPAATPSTARPSFGSIADRLAASPRSSALPVAAPSPIPAPVGIAAQLAERRRAREQDLAQGDGQAAALRREIAQLQARAVEVAARAERLEADLAQRRSVAATEDGSAIVGYLRDLRAPLERALAGRQRTHEAVDRARAAAITRFGAERVEEYDELRRRIELSAEGADGLARTAYEMLEKDRRAALRDYAAALDALHAAPTVRVRFIAFATDGAATLVAPLAADAILTAGAATTRIACAFWHATERAASELANGAAVEDGAVAGLLAVRFPAIADAALLEVLLDETMSTRPSLDAIGAEAEFELAEGVAVAFEPAPEVDAETAAAGEGEASGGTLPDVAARVGLSLRDVIAALHDHGLPFPDDEVDVGTESTLRALLDEKLPEREHEAQPTPAVQEQSQAPATLTGNVGLASRMLAKLLRDRRVGGRHTRMDNAWGHHFADGEKLAARRVAEWLEKDHIFLGKDNEHSHHISINPRRLRDVREIIEGTWARCAEMERA